MASEATFESRELVDSPDRRAEAGCNPVEGREVWHLLRHVEVEEVGVAAEHRRLSDSVCEPFVMVA